MNQHENDPNTDVDGPLILAVPSKGRLQENALAFFARAGLAFSQARAERSYRGAIKGVGDVEVAFLSASEIVAQLASGAAHLGVTGEDLVREQVPNVPGTIEMLTPLGFGHANVVVAVPQAWIDQLATGGRIIAPTLMPDGRQALVVLEKTAHELKQTVLEAVHFVPLKSGIA